MNLKTISCSFAPNFFKLALNIAMLACFTMFSPVNAYCQLMLTEGFETHDSLTHLNWWKISGNAKGYINSVCSREGKKSARFEVQMSDRGDFRSEITTGENNPAPKNYTIGQEYWYGVSIMPDKNLKKSPFPEIVFQFHSTPDMVPGETWESGLNPPVALYCDGQKWSIQVKGDDREVTDKKNYRFSTEENLGRVGLGDWTDWVFHIKWNYNGDGFVRIWKNGKMVYNLTGPNTFNDKTGPYLKMGVYAWYLKKPGSDICQKANEAAVGNRVYYHDSIRIAGKNADANTVSPEGRMCEPVKKEMEINWENIRQK